MNKRELLGVAAAIALAISPAIAFAQDKTTSNIAKTGTGGAATVQQAQDESDDLLPGLYIGGGVLATAGIIAGVAAGDGDDNGGVTTTTSTSTATATAPAPQ